MSNDYFRGYQDGQYQSRVRSDDSGIAFWFIMIGTAIMLPFSSFLIAWLYFGWAGVLVTVGAYALFYWRSNWFRTELKSHPYWTSMLVGVFSSIPILIASQSLGISLHQAHPNLFPAAQHSVAKK